MLQELHRQDVLHLRPPYWCCFVFLFLFPPTMLRFSSCLPKLTTVRAVMVRAALEEKNPSSSAPKASHGASWVSKSFIAAGTSSASTPWSAAGPLRNLLTNSPAAGSWENGSYYVFRRSIIVVAIFLGLQHNHHIIVTGGLYRVNVTTRWKGW